MEPEVEAPGGPSQVAVDGPSELYAVVDLAVGPAEDPLPDQKRLKISCSADRIVE